MKADKGFNKDMTCKTCKWWDAYDWICCNGSSDSVADTTHPEHWCLEWDTGE